MSHDDLSILRDLPADGGVLVAVSGGKDSIVTLDLCKRYFQRVQAFHMYVVPGISFIESYLTYLERRYEITIERVPHWRLSSFLRSGLFRGSCVDVRQMSLREVEDSVRRRTGLEWIATGEKKCDSLDRKIMMKHNGSPDRIRKKICPVQDWSHSRVYAYLKQHCIALPPDYSVWNRSWGYALVGSFLSDIRRHWPADYDRIRELFPLIDAETETWERYGKEREAARKRAIIERRSTRAAQRRAERAVKASGVRDSEGGAPGDQAG